MTGQALPRPVSSQTMPGHWIPVNLLGAPHHYTKAAHQYAEAYSRTIVSERDALAGRVRELEAALRDVEVFMSDLLRDSLEAEGFTGQQLERMVVMAKAPHITKPDSPLGKVIAALSTTPESKP